MIRLVIVDDHPMVREGLRAFLERTAGIDLVADAESVERALPLIERERPDLVLMDLVLSGLSGAAAVRAVTALKPAPRVLVLTSFGDAGRAADALAAGATGYLLKTVPPDDLVMAIQQAARGRGVWDQAPGASGGAPPGGALTPREHEVLRLLGRGLDNREIARRLGVSIKTVKTHTGRIYEKLMVADRTEAVVAASDLGLIVVGRDP